MKRSIFLTIALMAMSGCWRNSTDPQPGPKPEPPAHPAIVILHAAEDTDLAAYAEAALDQYADQHGYQLRIHPIDVVDETGKTPKYLLPYVEAAKGKTLPVAMVGAQGKVHQVAAGVTDAQSVMAMAEKTFGDSTLVKDGFWAAGQWRKLSSIKPCKPGADKRWTVEGKVADEPLIPEEKWRDREIACFSVWQTDQGQLSSCCPSSGCAAMATVANRSGLAADAWNLSPMDAYCRIADSDSGALLEDFWAVAAKEGVCTTAYCPEQGFSRRPPMKAGYAESRAKHRATRVTYCDGWEGMASAIQRGKPVHYGLLVTSQFSPKDGIIGPRTRRGGGGHAVLAIGMRKIDGQWYILTRNSWGLGWGGSEKNNVPKGCALIHSSWIEPMFGIFTIGAVVSPSDDPITVRIPAVNKILAVRWPKSGCSNGQCSTLAQKPSGPLSKDTPTLGRSSPAGSKAQPAGTSMRCPTGSCLLEITVEIRDQDFRPKLDAKPHQSTKTFMRSDAQMSRRRLLGRLLCPLQGRAGR